MSIARSLQTSVDKIRALHKRNNGDLEIFLSDALKDIEFDVERVRGLESMSDINTALLCAAQEKGAAINANHNHA